MHYEFHFCLLKKEPDDEYKINYTENQGNTFMVLYGCTILTQKDLLEQY